MSRSNPSRLRELREAAGLSQVRFAKLIGVSRNAVSQWEAGETVPTSRRLAKIGKVLGVQVGSILNESSIDSKEEIMSATERLVSRLGVRGTTAEIVCASVNVDRSKIDEYFGSIDQLFNEIVRRRTAFQLEELRKSPPLYGSILARLKYLLRSCYVSDIQQRTLTAEWHAYSWTWGERQEREHLTQLYFLDQFIYSIFEDAARKGQIRRGNFTEAAQLIMAAYVASLRKAVFENYDADQLIQSITPKLLIILEAFQFKDVPGFSED